jgi:hypothetical protein
VELPYRRTASPSPSYARCLVSLGWLVRRIDGGGFSPEGLDLDERVSAICVTFSRMVSNTVDVRYSSCQRMQLRFWRIRLLVIESRE